MRKCPIQRRCRVSRPPLCPVSDASLWFPFSLHCRASSCRCGARSCAAAKCTVRTICHRRVRRPPTCRRWSSSSRRRAPPTSRPSSTAPPSTTTTTRSRTTLRPTVSPALLARNHVAVRQPIFSVGHAFSVEWPTACKTMAVDSADGRPFWPRVAELFWTEPDVAGRSSSPRGLTESLAPFSCRAVSDDGCLLVSVIRLPIGAHFAFFTHRPLFFGGVGRLGLEFRWLRGGQSGGRGANRRTGGSARKERGHAKESEEKNGRQDGGEAGARRLGGWS